MSQSNSLISYEDVREMMSRAVTSERGIRIKLVTRGDAVKLRQRIYKFRQLDRAENRKMYALDDPRYGTSDFDGITVLMYEENAQWFVNLVKYNEEKLQSMIEEL